MCHKTKQIAICTKNKPGERHHPPGAHWYRFAPEVLLRRVQGQKHPCRTRLSPVFFFLAAAAAAAVELDPLPFLPSLLGGQGAAEDRGAQRGGHFRHLHVPVPGGEALASRCCGVPRWGRENYITLHYMIR